MALSQDFEKRRKERLAKQRREREKRKKIRKTILVLLGIIIILIIIVNIAKCGKSGTSTPEPSATAAVTEPIVTPASETSVTGIPEPDADNNDILSVIKDSGQKKHVYLTFDGGPDKTVTPQILDVLRRYNVKATFFVVGKSVEEAPYLCTRIMEEGHLAAPLSYTNNADILYEDKSGFMDEVNKTYELIVSNSPSASAPFKIYRFLGGSSSNTSYGSAKQTYKTELGKNGYYFADWNTTIDDEDGSKSAEQLLSNFETNRADVNNLVIQMHCTGKNASTAEMLGSLIEQLLGEGYTFSRLDEIDFSGADTSADDDSDATDAPSAEPSPQSAETSASSSASSATKAPTAAPKTVTATKAPSSSGSSSGSSGGSTSGTSGSTSGGSSNKSNGTSSGSSAASGGATSSGTAGSSSSGESSASGGSSSSGDLTPE